MRFVPEIKYAEDVFFTINFMAFAKKVIICEDHFYHVLVRSSSVTRNCIHELDKSKKRPDVESFLKKIIYGMNMKSIIKHGLSVLVIMNYIIWP